MFHRSNIKFMYTNRFYLITINDDKPFAVGAGDHLLFNEIKTASLLHNIAVYNSLLLP